MHAGTRLCVTVLCRTSRGLRTCLRALEDAGFTLAQLGDAEAWGYAAVEQIGAVLAALRPYRRREAAVGAGLRARHGTRRERAGCRAA